MLQRAAVILLTLSAQCTTVYGVQVEVAQGILEGAEVTSVLDKLYYSFKGIPYAKPPVGELRFKSPQPPENWEGVRNATEHGAVCPQFNILTSTYIPGDEDCLFLNVYSPDLKPKTPLPVIFYIFGGSFIFGSGNDDFYGPDYLVDRQVILVTINHRLGALGFLSTGTCDVPGNSALKDQVMALKWVKENISKFGGDPNQVTLMGGASGGASVGYHLISPMSKGLFKRAICMSAAVIGDWAFPYQPARRAYQLAKILGNDTSDSTELLSFLQSVSVSDLVNTNAYILASEEITDIPLKGQPHTPVVEMKCPGDNFLTTEPIATVKNGKINEVPVIFGYNSEEALLLAQNYNSTIIDVYNKYREMFVPFKILVNAKANTILDLADKVKTYFLGDKKVSTENIAEFIRYSSSAGIEYDVQRFFRRWADRSKSATYFYVFSGISNNNYYGKQTEVFGVTGVPHLDDVTNIFRANSLNLTVEAGSTEEKIMDNLVTVITNFAKSGNPDDEWSKFDTENLAYMDIAESLKLGSAVGDEDYKFWKQLFEGAGVDF